MLANITDVNNPLSFLGSTNNKLSIDNDRLTCDSRLQFSKSEMTLLFLFKAQIAILIFMCLQPANKCQFLHKKPKPKKFETISSIITWLSSGNLS